LPRFVNIEAFAFLLYVIADKKKVKGWGRKTDCFVAIGEALQKIQMLLYKTAGNSCKTSRIMVCYIWPCPLAGEASQFFEGR